MTRTEIEAWALRMIDSVKGGVPNEDSHVELKREWIEPKKAARRLAAHANAAGGEPILWLIGVDQENGVVGASHVELSNWWSRVQAEFNELTPELKDLVVTANGQTMVALLFSTDRAPFVVNATGGLLEVPWREGTRTNSAKRSDLVRLLAPTIRLPTFEILIGSFDVRKEEMGAAEHLLARVNMQIYVVPADDRRVVFPLHHTKLVLELRRERRPMAFTQVDFRLPVPDAVAQRSFGNPSLTVHVSTSELIVDGPGSFLMCSEGVLTDLEDYQEEGFITAHLKAAGSPAVVVLKAKMRQMNRAASVATWFIRPDMPSFDSVS